MRISIQDIRKRCLKEDESEKPLYARLVTHKISTSLIWLFQTVSMTPNALSLLALLFGFCAIPFFSWMSPLPVLIGAFLIEIYYIFDAVDGQWARFKNMKSLTGAFLDYLSNYAIHPPLLFSIAWGVFQKTNQPSFLIFGFSASFSCLWIILIWNLRASILLSQLMHMGKAPAKAKYGKPINSSSAPSTLKLLFGIIHKSFIFPWFINILTIVSCISYLFSSTFLFSIFLYYYGIIGPIVATLITAHWIVYRKLDHSPELQLNSL